MLQTVKARVKQKLVNKQKQILHASKALSIIISQLRICEHIYWILYILKLENEIIQFQNLTKLFGNQV